MKATEWEKHGLQENFHFPVELREINREKVRKLSKMNGAAHFTLDLPDFGRDPGVGAAGPTARAGGVVQVGATSTLADLCTQPRDIHSVVVGRDGRRGSRRSGKIV